MYLILDTYIIFLNIIFINISFGAFGLYYLNEYINSVNIVLFHHLYCLKHLCSCIIKSEMFWKRWRIMFFIGLIKNKMIVWYKSDVKGYLIEKKGIIKL
jgi:hypothetical protein